MKYEDNNVSAPHHRKQEKKKILILIVASWTTNQHFHVRGHIYSSRQNVPFWQALPTQFSLANTGKRGVSCARCQPKSSLNLPVVMTTPARTFRRAWGEVKLSVSSLNLSTTRRETASARTWNHTHKHTKVHAHPDTHTHASLCQICQLIKRLLLSSPGTPCTCHNVRIQLQTRVEAQIRQQVKLGWPPEVYLTVFKQFCLSLAWQF